MVFVGTTFAVLALSGANALSHRALLQEADVGSASCKVPDLEAQLEYVVAKSSRSIAPPLTRPSHRCRFPECNIGLFQSAAATNTCGQSTVIPVDKLGACPDAQAALDLHNEARARRGAAPLLWSKTLSESAQAVADTCVFAHSNTNYGENLAIGTYLDCEAGTKLWVDEEGLYDALPEPGFSSQTGHFSQVVWKNSLQVGCGYKACPNGRYVVCQYYPSGNWIGQFAEQVGGAGETPPCVAPEPVAPEPPVAEPEPPLAEPEPPVVPPPSTTPEPVTSPPPTDAVPSPPAECCVLEFCSPYLCPSAPSIPNPVPPIESPPVPLPPIPSPPPPEECCYRWGICSPRFCPVPGPTPSPPPPPPCRRWFCWFG